jgi:3-dehydroquinate synthase
MKPIRLSLRSDIDRSYGIEIRRGFLDQLPELLSKKLKSRRLFVITDGTVRRLYGRNLFRSLLQHGVDAWLIDFPAGEKSKNADVVHSLHTQLLENGVRRNSVVLALGGGVVGDVAGYVAATVLRGISCIQVPTTLLAQVDSSVGGKVGIDHPFGKNLIGAFHQPAAVYIDPTVLNTLPDREYRGGLAEVVKIAAALDATFFRFLERNISRIIRKDIRVIAEIIHRSIELKATVVMKDERESGLRQVLNLGHTIGHAVEAASDYKLHHGEAVAIGMIAESRIARDMGLLKERDFNRLVRLMKALRLHVSFPRIRNKVGFFQSLMSDKKSVGESARFALLETIGCTAVGVDVPSPFIGAILISPRSKRKTSRS